MFGCWKKNNWLYGSWFGFFFFFTVGVFLFVFDFWVYDYAWICIVQFKTFSERLQDIEIDVYHSLVKIKAEPSEGSSFFRDCLVEWRVWIYAFDFDFVLFIYVFRHWFFCFKGKKKSDFSWYFQELNTAADFISFYEEMLPLVQTLPMVLLHKESILTKLLSRLQMKARLSLEPILRYESLFLSCFFGFLFLYVIRVHLFKFVCSLLTISLCKFDIYIFQIFENLNWVWFPKTAPIIV